MFSAVSFEQVSTCGLSVLSFLTFPVDGVVVFWNFCV